MTKRLVIQIETENAAFDEAPAHEIARILHVLARRYEHDGGSCTGTYALYDRNGNKVGFVQHRGED